MVCDPLASLIDRVLERSKPGDLILRLDYPGEAEIKITRTEAGISIYQAEWYPAMGGREWTETFDGDAARAHLRQRYVYDDAHRAFEAKFPEFPDED